MQQLKKENPERYVRLEHILQRTFFDYNEVRHTGLRTRTGRLLTGRCGSECQAYPNGGNKERRRNQIANGECVCTQFHCVGTHPPQ